MTKEIAINIWNDFCKDASTIPYRQGFIGDKLQIMVYDIPVDGITIRVTLSKLIVFVNTINTYPEWNGVTEFDLSSGESYELRHIFHNNINLERYKIIKKFIEDFEEKK